MDYFIFSSSSLNYKIIELDYNLNKDNTKDTVTWGDLTFSWELYATKLK